MARVRRLRAVDDDIEHALRYTLRTYGVHKYQDYAALIQEALETLAENPEAGYDAMDLPRRWRSRSGAP